MRLFNFFLVFIKGFSVLEFLALFDPPKANIADTIAILKKFGGR
jgi:hypothetical protein